MKVLAIIPARSGSKGVKDKNIRLVNKIPLMAYTISAAIKSEIFDEIMVSTDSIEYASIAKKYGASVPFLRNEKTSSDTAKTLDCVLEVLDEYRKIGKIFNVLIILQPTSPLRDAEDIRGAYETFLKHKKSVASVCEGDNVVLLRTISEGILEKIVEQNSTIRRQDFKKNYKINGAIYINYIKDLDENTSFNDNEIAFIMEKSHSLDIDTEWDLKIFEHLL
ncbi:MULTISPECIES: acylneuraminate cytidylyltransferase family protein [unclassified Campylobacter]|uniref:acylneuraminate cytidylyltransferase family protein n=1 Tax=unclassified Campylobacter TaxID=2593542 RepID=UPI001DBBE4F6|nr:acylneuraminate cytidylyltransferase family protein [Campylobacter sp. RM12651]MBZ7984104.1 acylneuraminate cytidylyltransferase family protein [Campylobacter sp. RM12647]MBZ7993396.1 acylneuraminate cytidylyltransferase family protein [Campylobacter sp. RM9333]ULO02569.1 CMP-N-acetylneuraminic acid synthetase [Campylobacter sp. RM12651]